MANYKSLYIHAFNALTDAGRLLEQAQELIETAQRQCEDMYIESEDDGE